MLPFAEHQYPNKKKQFGYSFAFDAPFIWKDLPETVRLGTSASFLPKKLKAYLLAKAFPP